MSTEHPTSPSGEGRWSAEPYEQALLGRLGFVLSRWWCHAPAYRAAAGRPRHRANVEGGADPPGCRVSDARCGSMLLRWSCFTVPAGHSWRRAGGYERALRAAERVPNLAPSAA